MESSLNNNYCNGCSLSHQLNLMYEFGEGVNQNERNASELIKELTDKEYLDAQSRLGYIIMKELEQ